MANLLWYLVKIVLKHQSIIQTSQLNGLETCQQYSRLVQRTITRTLAQVFSAKIFNPMQAKVVPDHITGTHVASPPLHTIYTYKIGKAVTVNNSFAPKLSTFTFREDNQEWGAPQCLVNLLDDP